MSLNQDPSVFSYPAIHRTRGWGEWLVLAFALCLPTSATYLYFVLLSGQPIMQTAYSVSKVVQFALPVIWVYLVRREVIDFGLRKTGGLLLGIGFGLVVAVSALVLYFFWLKHSPAFAGMSAGLKEKVGGMGALSPVRFLILGAFISFIHSLMEEYFFRWFIFGRLRGLIGIGLAVVVSSLGFMAHHILVLEAYIGRDYWPITAFLSISIAVGGAFWAWLYHKYNSLLAPWISHMLVDCALIAIGYDQLWGL